MNPSYGVLTTAADLAKLMKTFLDPTRPDCLISPYTLREWLRPMYAWIDDLTEVGLLWEILKVPDAFGRRQRVYQKRMFIIIIFDYLSSLVAKCSSF